MKSFSWYAAYIVRKLWSLTAMLVVAIAVLLSLARFSLPHLDAQKQRIESYFLQQYGLEVSIGEIQASWQGNGPDLLLRDIQLIQNSQSPLAFTVKQTHIKLDLWASLWQRHLQSDRFALEGLNLSIDFSQMRQAEGDLPIVDALKSLFLDRLKQFSIEQSHLTLKNHYDQQRIAIEQLRWLNKGDRHQGEGHMRVAELASNTTYFVLDLKGDKDSLDGQFFAKAEALDISPWVSQLFKGEYELQHSRANLEIWATVSQSQVDGVEINLQRSDFSWQRQQDKVNLFVESGQWVARPVGQNWYFELNDFTLGIDGQQLTSQWLGRYGASGSQFSLAEKTPLGGLLPMARLILDDQQWQQINGMSPTAVLEQFDLYNDKTQNSLIARVVDIGWQQHQLTPGVQGMNAQLWWSAEQGYLEVFSQEEQLSSNNLLAGNIDYQLFELKAHIERHPSGWFLFSPQITFESDLVTLQQQLAYHSGTQDLSIRTFIEPLKMAQVRQLLPKQIMGDDTREYLISALKAGQVEHAALIWQGGIGEFPFTGHQGVFQAGVELSNAEFEFDPGWPAMSNMQASLLFENESLVIESQSATLLGVEVQHAKGVIPKLAEDSHIRISAIGKGSGPQVAKVMQQSTLADSVGKVLNEQIPVSGALNANLELHIPFIGNDVIAKGNVSFASNQVQVEAISATFEEVSGELSFVNEKINSEDLTAKLLGQPVEIDLAANQREQGYLVDVKLTGDWQLEPLLANYHPSLQPYLGGSSGWKAQVKVTLPEHGFTLEVDGRSTLANTRSLLPAPFDKQAGDHMPARLQISGDQDSAKVQITLADNIRFNGLISMETVQFSRAHLAINTQQPLNQSHGFGITANVAEIDVENWFEAISALLDTPKATNPLFAEADQIYVNAEQVNLVGHEFTDVQLRARQYSKDWSLMVNADQAKAGVTFYHDWLDKGLAIDADFINLPQVKGDALSENEPFSTNSNYESLPPIQFSCRQCRYGDMRLGQISLDISRGENSMKIDRLTLKNRAGSLEASGDWLIDPRGSQTLLSGKLNSGDFGDLLSEFGINSGIKDSGANFDFRLSWSDAPHRLTLADLNGEVKWHLTDGYITKIGDQGSRIFSLFSLESLVRKLSLDFRDVFAKGFFYDKMDGTFQIDMGKMITQDTVIDGAAGEMTLAGYTDLNAETLDYQIGFTPNVTSSLPVLVYFMVNPATALAALALDSVLTEAKVIYYARYAVTGTWQDPVITELKRDAKDIQLPARNEPKPDNEQEQIDAPLPITLNVSDD